MAARTARRRIIYGIPSRMNLKGETDMLEEVRAILAEQLSLNAAEIKEDARLKEDLGADSLDMLQLLMTLEEEKDIVIPDEELPAIKTVGDIVRYLEER